jgi:hypothetical protein
VIYDTATGRSKGYGFVRFTMESERDRALNEMSGVFVGSRAIRCRLATAKQSGGIPGDRGASGPGGGGAGSAGIDRDRGVDRGGPPSSLSGPDEFNNTTLFVGGLSPLVRLSMQYERCKTMLFNLKIPR